MSISNWITREIDGSRKRFSKATSIFIYRIVPQNHWKVDFLNFIVTMTFYNRTWKLRNRILLKKYGFTDNISYHCDIQAFQLHQDLLVLLSKLFNKWARVAINNDERNHSQLSTWNFPNISIMCRIPPPPHDMWLLEEDVSQSWIT